MRCPVVASALVFGSIALSFSPPPSLGQSVSLKVEAGEHDRWQTPVKVLISLPEAVGHANVVSLEAEDGSTLVGQLTQGSWQPADEARDGQVFRELHFILPKLSQGESARFTIKSLGKAPEAPEFSWKETDQGDLLSLGDDPVMLYVRPELDESSPEARELTYKPFHHLFAPDGKLLTKGPGGLFTHHRGLFFGFNRISYGDGKQADVWHARGKAYQSHEETMATEAGPVLGRNLVRIDWHGQEGEVFASETRQVTAYATEGGRLIEFEALVETVAGPVMLDGDPQHAGVQFRAHNQVADVTKGQTYYLRPDGKGKLGETRNWEPSTGEGPVNLPWNAMSFVLDDQRYTAVYLDHPENPKEARYSERDYGRFGSYFEYLLTEDRPLHVRYRLWLQPGELTLEQAAALDADFDAPVSVEIIE